MEQLRFEFADIPADSNQLFHELRAFLLQLFEIQILGPCRDLEITILPLQFFHLVAVIRFVTRLRFGIIRKLCICCRRISDWRLLGLFFFNRPHHTFRRDVVATFVLVEERVEPGDTLSIDPAPVDDAAFRARYTFVLKKSCDLAHRQCVIFSSFGKLPHIAERFRIVPNISEWFGSLRNVSEFFRSRLSHNVFA